MGRHAADDPDDTSSAWGMRWEPVADDDSGESTDPRRRTRIRALVAACVVGAVAIVAITVIAVRLAVDDVNERTGPQRIHQRYEAQYRTCVGGGATPAACAERTFDRCAADGDWGDPPDQTAVLDNCRFGPAAQSSASASTSARSTAS